jgi:hypothetical protein
VVSQDDFGCYQSGGWTWGRTDYAVSLATFDNRPHCRSASSITDGVSSTILIGEKAFNPVVEQPSSWYWDEPFFLGGSKGTSRGGTLLLRDGDGQSRFKDNWGSAHENVTLFLFGDCAVHALGFEIDPQIFASLLTPAGGDLTAPP